MNNTHKKKIITTIFFTLGGIVYYLIYFGVLIYFIDGILKYVLGIVPIIFVALFIYVCIERIKEIQGGEEDDLSQY
ncbi:hypothetical protein SAMN02745115_01625 [[Eubacterium] yurii]|jgi:hypothetical protein|nr:hypothetical protein SAMN02745115_01625 [[Eubacterium] yurii]